MTTPKARYTGSSTGKARPVNRRIADQLGAYCPPPDGYDTASPEDQQNFVDEILIEADWAADELAQLDFQISNQQLRAEQQDLLKTLGHTIQNLRSNSPELVALLPPDSDPLGAADLLEKLVGDYELAGTKIDRLGPGIKRQDKEYAIATEFAARILNTLDNYGIARSATKSFEFDYVSPAVKILKIAGDSIGLIKSEATWRDIIQKSKSGL